MGSARRCAIIEVSRQPGAAGEVMRAEILSIGTELLLGSITDTNAPYLAQRLAALGIDCYYISQVGDNPARLAEAISRAWERSELTVTTGGLGPTTDDLTREAIAEALGEELTLDEELAQRVSSFFRRRGLDMPERNLKQAMLIPSAAAIANPVGTAPGWWVGKAVKGSEHRIVSMPGVPFEMKRMWEQEIEPQLRLLSDTVIVSRTLKILGVGESAAEQKVLDLMSGANPTLAPYAKPDGVHLRITAKALSEAEAQRLIAPLEAQVRARLGQAIYGADADSPASVVGALLRAGGFTLALVEVGEGAVGSLIPQLAGDSSVVARYSARELGRLHLANAGDLEGAAKAAIAEAGADFGLALCVGLEPDPDRPGATLARTEIIVVSSKLAGGLKRASQRWSTARGEVSRLVGLAALNELRLALLALEG